MSDWRYSLYGSIVPRGGFTMSTSGDPASSNVLDYRGRDFYSELDPIVNNRAAWDVYHRAINESVRSAMLNSLLRREDNLLNIGIPEDELGQAKLMDALKRQSE